MEEEILLVRGIFKKWRTSVVESLLILSARLPRLSKYIDIKLY
jgi:hypothetical protein